MGNRAVIIAENAQGYIPPVGIYLHWCGGYNCVAGWLAYCRMVGFPSPDGDNYGWARMAQVMGNTLDGRRVSDGMSLGIISVPDASVNVPDRTDEKLEEVLSQGDNGIYIIRDWKIVHRIGGYANDKKLGADHLREVLEEIDEMQPWHVPKEDMDRFIAEHGEEY